MKKVLVLLIVIIFAVLFSCKQDPSGTPGGSGEGGSITYSENWKLVDHPVAGYKPMYVHISKPIMVAIGNVEEDISSGYLSLEFKLSNAVSINLEKDSVRVVFTKNNSETLILNPGMYSETVENIFVMNIGSGDDVNKLISLIKNNNRLTFSLEIKRENESIFTPLLSGTINCTGFYTNIDDIKKYNPHINFEKYLQLVKENGFGALYPES